MPADRPAVAEPTVVDGRYMLLRPIRAEHPEQAWLAVDLEHRAVVLADPQAQASAGPSVYIQVEALASGLDPDGPPRYEVELRPCGPSGPPTPEPALMEVLARCGAGQQRRVGAPGAPLGTSADRATASSPLVAELLGCLGEQDPEARAHAAHELGRAGDVSAVGPLIAALEDPDPDVRRYAAAALGELGDARAVQPLVSRLQDADDWVTQWAASALAALGESPRSYSYRGEYTVVDGDGEEKTVHAEE